MKSNCDVQQVTKRGDLDCNVVFMMISRQECTKSLRTCMKQPTLIKRLISSQLKFVINFLFSDRIPPSILIVILFWSQVQVYVMSSKESRNQLLWRRKKLVPLLQKPLPLQRELSQRPRYLHHSLGDYHVSSPDQLLVEFLSLLRDYYVS